MSPFASRIGRALIAALVVLSGLVADAAAQPKSPTDQARELAREGWKALDQENYKVALDKVTQAEALYHAPTHLLLLGNALAGLGRLAEALATFEKLTAEPLPDASPKPFKDAQENGKKRMKELLARVPSLLVVVQSAEAHTAVVTVDGNKVDYASGIAVRFDPGDHAVVVEADGFVTVKRTITLPEKGGVVRVPIVLEKVGEPASTATGSASASASPSVSATAQPEGGSRLPAYVAFGVAGAGLVVGAITGGMSLKITGDLKARCQDDKCKELDRPDIERATTLAHVSTASFVAAGVLAATGVIVLAINVSSKPKTGSAATVQPWITVGGAGVRGSF